MKKEALALNKTYYMSSIDHVSQKANKHTSLNVKVILTKTEKLSFLVHYVQPSVEMLVIYYTILKRRFEYLALSAPPSTTNGEKFYVKQWDLFSEGCPSPW